MMDLGSLRYNEGARHKKKRVGRGEGSGRGVTAGRGNKGQRSRGGSGKRAWFEGGQMPLQRRLPKFGFANIHRKAFQVVNVADLEKMTGEKEITRDVLHARGLIRKKTMPVKILGNGELKSKVQVRVDAISKVAREKIEKLGGTVTLS
jgi:large subunit ribosomal protein L15